MVAAAIVALAAVRAGSEDSVPAPGCPPESSWRAGRPVPIAVTRGRAIFSAATAERGSGTLVIVSALAKSPGPFPIRLTARPVAEARPPALASQGPRGVPDLAIPPLPPVAETVAAVPPLERTFHLLVRDGDVSSASNYQAVQGRLRAVGHRVQVYVDAQDISVVGAEVLCDLVTTFDDQVFPTAARTLGQANDIDGDGRFTVLISSWLTRLAGGRHAVDGFVRGADLDPILSAPFSNRCDMMYLSTALGPGPYLRTVLAHEYTHAVTFSAKAAAGLGADEEGWLDEAMAHLGEDLHGFSRANLDYRVSAFLSRPERYRLVVDDYFADDLFRSPGNRGSTYLFLRWCADRFGPDLLPALIRSPRRGVANLEAATGVPFADLYRQWSTALYLSGLDPSHQSEIGFRSLDVRGPFDDWDLAGPRPVRVTPGGAPETWSAAGTSSRFVVVEPPTTGAVEVEVTGPPDAEVQVTAIPLPGGMARLDLSARVSADANGDLRLRIGLAERAGIPMRLTALAWEPLVPAADPHAPGFRRDGLDVLGIASTFGTSALPAHGRLHSRPIRLRGIHPDSGPLVIKAVGTDAQGRRIAAWAEVDLTSVRDDLDLDDDPLDL